MQILTTSVRTEHREQIIIVTNEVNELLRQATAESGLVTVMTPHTTTAISVNENADPDVPPDLLRALKAMVPAVQFDHAEGNSDAHLLSSIVGVSLTLPFEQRRLRLGRWQGIYLFEFDGPRTRTLELYLP